MKLGYESRGDESGASPLVFLHAFPLTSAMWDHQLKHFARERRVLTLDLRGYGKSVDTDGSLFDVAQYARDVRETLTGLGITRAIFTGCSMGGYVIFELWRQEPGLFSGMVLADTRAEADNEEARAKRQKQTEQIQQQGAGFMPEFVVENLLSPYTRSHRPKVVAEVKQLVGQASPGTIVSTLRMLASRPDSGPTLATIDVPCLVAVGEDDQVTPRELSERLVRDIPNAELHIIPQAGHLSPLENPDEFNRTLDEFLTTNKLL